MGTGDGGQHFKTSIPTKLSHTQPWTCQSDARQTSPREQGAVGKEKHTYLFTPGFPDFFILGIEEILKVTNPPLSLPPLT